MKRKREKGYWKKQSEQFTSGTAARSRAGELRSHEHIAHVVMQKRDDEQYVVAYSIAEWYLNSLKEAGVKL